MITYAPDYYKNFKCISSACRHNCCIGWEIDIDSSTLEKYKNTSYMEKIDTNCDSPHFILEKNGRCPFLNKENLCDIIISSGESFLCDICNDHPRFRNFFVSRTEIGLGLCCEAAGHLILTHKSGIELVKIHSDGSPDKEMPPEEEFFFSLRNRIFELLKNPAQTLDNRIKQLSMLCNINIDSDRYIPFFSELERLDSQWDSMLPLAYSSDYTFDSQWDVPFENLILYFIFRHLSGAVEDGLYKERIAFSILSFFVIRNIFARHTKSIESLVEISRLYSSEIEYSEENITRLFEKLTQL